MTRLLVMTRTLGYRHVSIEAGVAALRELAGQAGVLVDDTDDPARFTVPELGRYAAVVWLSVSGTGVLNAEQRQAYEVFTAAGGGFVGIHGASDAERDWPLYDRLVGARFASHPPGLQAARVRWTDPGHPAATDLPDPWTWTEEWYAFTDNPRSRVDVVATVDERTYRPGESAMGTDHPVCWQTRVGACRAFYTALGHDESAYGHPDFRSHLWGGVAWVLGESGDAAGQSA